MNIKWFFLKYTCCSIISKNCIARCNSTWRSVIGMCGSTWTKVRLLCQSSSPLMPTGQDFKWVTAVSSFLIAMLTAPTKCNCLLQIPKSCLQFHQRVLFNICDFFYRPYGVILDQHQGLFKSTTVYGGTLDSFLNSIRFLLESLILDELGTPYDQVGCNTYNNIFSVDYY